MAIYHLAVKHASRAQGRSARAHASYIAREGPYATGHFAEQFVQVEHRNMPDWAREDPQAFWAAADAYERANGRLYTELEIALPRELPAAEQEALARTFIDQEIGTAHPCTWALHVSTALDGGAQPHMHVMLSERTHDGIERGPAQFFRRANPSEPACGGAAKDPAWNQRDKVEALRVAWETTANQALARAGLAVRIDHRSLAAQGLDRAPEPKLGPEQTAMLRRGVTTPESAQVIDLRAYRARLGAVEQAVERTQARVIDLTQARAAREAREREREQAAQRAREARLAQVLARVPDPAARVTALVERVAAREAARLEGGRQIWERVTGTPCVIAQGERVTGRLVDRVEMAGAAWGRVETRTGTTALVPWRPAMAEHVGQTVAVEVDATRRVRRLLGPVELAREPRPEPRAPTRAPEHDRSLDLGR